MFDGGNKIRKSDKDCSIRSVADVGTDTGLHFNMARPCCTEPEVSGHIAFLHWNVSKSATQNSTTANVGLKLMGISLSNFWNILQQETNQDLVRGETGKFHSSISKGLILESGGLT